MDSSGELVFVVDDDVSVREAVAGLIRSVGIPAESFGSAREFLLSEHLASGACLVLDLQMPELTGLDLQRVLADAGRELPIIFLTAHGDVRTSVQAMKAGAFGFLSKPFDEHELLNSVREALEEDRLQRVYRKEVAEIRRKYLSLSDRERLVMRLLLRGMLNKQIAAQMGLSEITIKVHRRHIREKMGVESLADLALMVTRLPEPLG
jgi:FixJ family two-component response regulator